MSGRFEVSGLTAPNGIKYVWAAGADGSSAFLARSKFSLGNKRLVEDLACRGLQVFDRQDLAELIAAVKKLELFPDGKIATRVGWGDDGIFARADGTIVWTNNFVQRWSVFPYSPVRPGSTGDRVAWKKTISDSLSGQALPVFVIAVSICPALLRFVPHIENFVIEIVEDSGRSDGFINKIASSVVGGISANADDRYWRSLSEVVDDFDVVLEKHCDHPLIIGGVDAFFASADPKRKKSAYQRLVFDLATSRTRTVALISGQQTLRSNGINLLGSEGRLFSIVVPRDALHGIFSYLPEHHHNVTELGEGLCSALEPNSGNAYLHFVEKAVLEIESNEEEFRRRIRILQEDFINTVRILNLDRDRYHIEQAFSIIYAAAELAVEFGTLPNSIDCMASTVAAYELCLLTHASPTSFLHRLEQLLESSEIAFLDLKTSSPAQVEAAEAAIGSAIVKSGKVELRIREKKILETFPDWDAIKHDRDVRQLLKTDGRNLRVYRTLAPGLPRERLYCFVLGSPAVT